MLRPVNMNYEDRTDLLAPEAVVSGDVLERLAIPADEAVRLMFDAARDPSATHASAAAREVIEARVQEDTVPAQGAPAEAAAIETDAMLCGYRFGRLALGEPGEAVVAPSDLRERVDGMYLYALDRWGSVSALEQVLARHPGAHTAALDEAAAWAWSYGLGLAVVETDLAQQQ